MSGKDLPRYALESVSQPDKSKYCCVKNEYLTFGEYQLSWNDKGKSKKHLMSILLNTKKPITVSLWKAIRGSDTLGTEGGYFKTVKKNGWSWDEEPAPNPAKLLKVDGEKVCNSVIY